MLKSKTITDMTVGSPFKVITKFAMPMLLSMVFVQLYNIMDSVIAGQFIGMDALAAVGVSFPIISIFIAIGNGASMGASMVISQCFGSHDEKRLRSSITTTLIFMAVVSVVCTLLGVFTCKPLLRLLSTPEELMQQASDYLLIYSWSLAFLFMYNAATAVFTALGNSKTPLYLLIFSVLLNIALNVLFTVVFKWGVKGIAWATFIAQGIACVLAFVILFLKTKQIRSVKAKAFDGRLLKRILINAIPSIMQGSFVSVGQLFIQGLINSYGTIVMAGYAAAIKVNVFAVNCINTMSTALSSYTAQNYGARNKDRIIKGMHATFLLSSVIYLLLMLILFISPEGIIGLFVSGESSDEVVRVGVQFIRIVAPFLGVVMIKCIYDAVMRGVQNMIAFSTSTLIDLIARVGGAFALSAMMGSEKGVWWSWPIGWIIGTIIAMGFYYFWKRNRSNLIVPFEPPEYEGED